jgi:hypothetical protein
MPSFDVGSKSAAGDNFGPLYDPATGRAKFLPGKRYGVGTGIADSGNPFKPIVDALAPKANAPKTDAKAMTLNDFIALAKTSGKSNATNRGYQMFKNYKRTGKLPARRVRPD